MQVRATSSAGESYWSESATGTPASQPPDAPAKPTLTSGNRKLEVSWSKPAQNDAPISIYKVQYSEGDSDVWNPYVGWTGTTTFTIILPLINGQSYKVQVRATSSAGESDWSESATGTPAPQPPDAPAKPTLTSGNRKLEVSWSKPAQNDAPISIYKVQYSEGDSDVWNPYVGWTGTTTFTIIPRLTNGQSYKVQVRATSSAGESDWSESATGTPAPQPPDAPAKPTLTSGNRKLEVSWSKPAQNDAPISIYKVQYSEGDSDVWNPYVGWTGTTTFTIIPRLTNGQSYKVQVRATSSAGESKWSPTATGTPGPEVPDTPGALALTPGNAQLRVTWSVPSGNGADITDYKVEYRTGSSGWTDHPFSGTGTSTIILSLTNNQPYHVQVRATSEAGSSDWSDFETGTPKAQSPSAPNAPRLTPGNGELEVSWSALSINGADITGYKVEYRTGSSGWTDHPFSGTGTTIDGLTNGRSYRVRVRATSSAGNSDWSPIATGAPAAKAPDAPNRPTLTEGNGQLGVSWTEPATNGASITGYKVEYRTGSSGWTDHPFSGTGTTTNIPSLTNGQSYQVRVRMTSSAGSSDWSQATTDTPAPEAPSAPEVPALTPGNGQLGVSWTAPSDNGADISDYDVQYRQGNTDGWTDYPFSDTGTSTTIDGLTNGQSYQVQVRAINSAGNGRWSDSATGTPGVIAPNAPRAPLLTSGNGQLGVSWTAPSDNGADISDYDVQYREGSSRDWSDHPFSDTGTSTTIDGLTNARSYQVQVRATNSTGNGRWSDRTTGTPGAIVPNAPNAPLLTPGNGQLGVSWTAPSDNDADITGYDVQYREGSSGDWSDHPFSGTGTSTAIDGLTNGRSYQVQVRATNSASSSQWSDSVTGTPEAVVIEWVSPATGGSISEDTDTSANRVKIADLGAIDPEVGDSPVYSVEDTTHFEVDGSSLYLKQDVQLDHETTPIYLFTVTRDRRAACM